MNEEEIKKIAQEVYDQNNSTDEFTVSSIPFHTHNGTDSQKIKQDNILPGNLSIIDGFTQSSETDVLNTLHGVNILTLHAIAANGLGQKAVINGTAQLGKCYIYNWTGASQNIPVVGGGFEPFLQSCSAVYLDAADIANVRVQATGDSLVPTYARGYLAYVADNTASVVASMQIIEWTGTAIKIQTTLAANWYIKWFLSMS